MKCNRIQRHIQKTFLLLMLVLAICKGLSAANATDPRDDTILRPLSAAVPPKIDGMLDDAAWNTPILERDFVSYYPRYGEVLPQKTTVYMTYDRTSLYFAFHCFDTEPQKIKTSVTSRDNMFNDDWVEIVLDSQASGQNAQKYFVNPNGIQGDSIASANSDSLSPDLVWKSAGKVTDDGYQVELAIPLRTLRFQSGKNVHMRIKFVRKISRLGLFGCWPEFKAGYGNFFFMSPVEFEELKASRNISVLPALTVASSRQRETPEAWAKRDTLTGFGIDFKYGITSAVTAEATINPDFSQVESDTFQVTVNQRYPIFNWEKRPFFMETSELFNLAATGSDQNMTTTFHSRKVVDPAWGLRMTGTTEKVTFGVLTAEDTGENGSNGANPNTGNSALVTVARGKYNLKGEDYVGLFYSGRESSGTFNRAAGCDFSFHPLRHQQIQLFFLQSASTSADSRSREDGSALSARWDYSSNPLGMEVGFVHFGPQFRLDSGFYNRTGFSKLYGLVSPAFYPKKSSWLMKINPYIWAEFLHDLKTNLNDQKIIFCLKLNFTKQAWLSTSYVLEKEGWINSIFGKSNLNISGGIQLYKWLNLGGSLYGGDKIYYDLHAPYLGTINGGSFSVNIQPGTHFSQNLSFSRSRFTHQDKEIYEVNILNTRTVYQFNRYFFVRTIFQYDSYNRKWLTDFLASFTYIPGTVIYLGYGGLYEWKGWETDHWVPGIDRYREMKNSLFFKVSYLWQL